MTSANAQEEPSCGQAYKHLVVIGASAGGLHALSAVLERLPEGFPAPIAIVQHLDPRRSSLLAPILSRHCRLPVVQAGRSQSARPGVVYIAPPAHHLVVREEGELALTEAPEVHFARPSIDFLFESAALSCWEKTIAVVLTGTGSDGSRGLAAIKEHGGVTIAQDQESSEFFGMPQAAIRTGNVDYVLPLAEIAPALVTLVAGGTL